MAYVALYRAYRPQKFSEVVGQEHIKATLQNAIKMNKVAHAYLFCGPRGTGKTTMAKIMAKALNCQEGPTIEPCCKCEICEGITKGTISDVIEIDAASNNGADDIRALRDTVKFLPAVGRYKVYIIDEVHMLSNAAFNALLKTLEEPPKHVIFILATTEPYKLPNTILSRCQRFDFKSISTSDILKRLKLVAKEENIKASAEAFEQIALASEGGMRDALSLFDQCISYSVNEEITLDDVLAVSGNTSYLKLIELLNACISENEGNSIAILDSILKEGKEVPRLTNDLILFLRDVLLYKNNTILEDKIVYKNEAFVKLQSKLSKPIIYSWLNILNDALNQMRFSTQKRAFIELAVLKLNDNELTEEANLLDRIESLEKTVEMLSTKALASKPRSSEVVFTPTYPTNDDYSEPVNNQIFEDIKVPSVSKPTNVEYVSSVEVVDVLNNGSKAKKLELINALSKLRNDYSDYAFQTLASGNIVAATNDKFIVVLNDLPFCNRIMQYENYIKITEILLDNNLSFNDYICIPQIIWDSILTEWRSKYSKDNPKPIIESFSTGVKKRILPAKEEIKEEKSVIDNVKDLFDNNIKIVEE